MLGQAARTSGRAINGIAAIPGVSAVFAASGDLGNFSGYKQGTPDYERLINVVHDAALAAGKRLCSAAEFQLACEGPDAGNWYPYGGETRVPGDCNEGKGSSVPMFYGDNAADWTYADFNDPRLNEWDGGLAKTGAYTRCVSPYGVYDCVGNLHEWGSDPADSNGHGRFRGGYYGDAQENGPGCLYVTSAHELAYHDYSTGFRCCMDATE